MYFNNNVLIFSAIIENTTNQNNRTTTTTETFPLLPESQFTDTNTTSQNISMETNSGFYNYSILSNSTLDNSTLDSNSTSQQSAALQHHPFTIATPTLIAIFTVCAVSVLVVIALLWKVLFEGYKRRHYQKIDYLVEGMYS